ncbi:isotrichodermin C-15 hydroxylase [Colletotrichum scovillei]|uniref:Isotrichodermin C-15 hydroxylase n=1 Tax=Colletotrichum scovillei TaxID=1209932 RepID=A0A9P7RA57_9PEZI|nr:isotrichodermin C-15 hydroxylase [Colletotrichum scovillei]KAG7071942.1 isotrichodermin C-15 hydroxylase [Colletotrichum scovillei]KAG7080185.1 isotrichodermin C-15 hydroxylase [Colletotrichum scovillei]
MAGVLSILSEHPSHILAIAFGTAVLWQLLLAGYNLFLHPLRRFPGPVLQRASPLIWAWQHATGYQAFRTQHLHDRYGPIVRISPNHLSFTDVTAWKDIYGFQIGKELAENEIPKSQLFSTTIKNLPTSIINAEREEHQRYRRALSHGFSDSSMRAQEGIIMKYVDKLISRLHENCDGEEAPINVEAWYNWTTFDIAGDLIFAQSFGCLDRSDYHPWIAFIFKTIRYNAIMTAMKYIGLDPVVQGLFRIGGLAAMMQLRESTDKMMQTRLDMDPDRKDLFEGLLRKKEEWACGPPKPLLEGLSANGLILVLAGSETTATTLAGTTYLLLRNPKALQKLNEEVRSSFTDSSEITINSVSKLPYMLAVLNEALRMYPPVTSNLIREVPEFGCQIGAEHVPQGTFVEIQQWSANHSPDNWTKPWEFRPERFLETNKEEHNHLDALQAFSVGPRNCIGKNLAYAEMRLILARIVFDFDLQLAEGNGSWIQRQRAFGLWDRIPLNVYLKPVAREARA